MMKKTVVLSVFVIIAFACSIAFAGQLSVQTKEGVGPYLADAKGMTLYTFKKDSAGKSACEGDCLTKWPIFYGKKFKAPNGVDKKDFGVIIREDNKKKQTTFRGMPLYYFFKDVKAGDTNGNGINNVWSVADPATFKPGI
jgi:predicted lipoprotein with Yx(FWY)xxD motif